MTTDDTNGTPAEVVPFQSTHRPAPPSFLSARQQAAWNYAVSTRPPAEFAEQRQLWMANLALGDFLDAIAVAINEREERSVFDPSIAPLYRLRLDMVTWLLRFARLLDTRGGRAYDPPPKQKRPPRGGRAKAVPASDVANGAEGAV